MKTIKVICLSLLLLSCSLAGFSQVSKDAKANTKLNQSLKTNKMTKTQLDATKLDLKLTQVPEFTNIQPTSLNKSVNPNIKIEDLKQANVLSNPSFALQTSSVNSTLTPRDPYHSSQAYIEILTGDVNPGTNEVFCRCGNSGLTFIKVNLKAQAGKRYLVTIDHSPVNNSSGLSIFTTGFVHQANATTPHTKTDVVLSASETGFIELWVQCSDPNGSKKPWIFHGAEIKLIE